MPRVINILADKALLAAYAEGERSILRRHAIAAIEDSPSIARPLPFLLRWRFAGFADA